MPSIRRLTPARLRCAAGILGTLCLAFVAFASLSPITMRPQVAGQGIEHFLALLVLAGFLGIGYPRHLVAVLVGGVLFAIRVEYL